jgi:murein hydrolase activator
MWRRPGGFLEDSALAHRRRGRVGLGRGLGAPRAVVALALLLASVIAPAESLQAGLWSPDTAPGYGLAEELERLGQTRERLIRREALRRALDRQIGELTREIGGLLRQARQARVALHGAKDALRAQERELDRIVPRLVARANAVAERREQAARVLADLASLSRRDDLDPTTRARMRAISPVLLGQLRDDDAATAALARQGDRAVDQQRSLVEAMPVLHAETERLARTREHLTDQRRSAVRDRAWLAHEVRRLSVASARLARRLLVVEAAHRARAEPGANQPVPEREPPAPWSAAAVRGQAAAAPRLAHGVRARQPGLAQAVGSAPKDSLTLYGSTVAARAPVLPPARSVAGLGGLKSRAGSSHLLARQVQARSVATSIARLSSRLPVARLPRPEPIRPSLDAAVNRFYGGDRKTGITIAAAPGQRVAAPESGRVVFADAFKSYGLLLIIQHDNEYHSVLWGFSRLRVGFGDEVQGGQIIGVMDVVEGALPELHVELRRNGRPVNPSPWLAASSSKVRG